MFAGFGPLCTAPARQDSVAQPTGLALRVLYGVELMCTLMLCMCRALLPLCCCGRAFFPLARAQATMRALLSSHQPKTSADNVSCLLQFKREARFVHCSLPDMLGVLPCLQSGSSFVLQNSLCAFLNSQSHRAHWVLVCICKSRLAKTSFYLYSCKRCCCYTLLERLPSLEVTPQTTHNPPGACKATRLAQRQNRHHIPALLRSDCRSTSRAMNFLTP